jgi:ABC-type transport system involved in multi-copper enzyme maturation permease subunit
MPIEASYVAWAVVYGLLYILFLIGLAAFIFERRDFR